jgi:hypothetical protein
MTHDRAGDNTYMVYGMDLAAKLKDQDLVRQVQPDLIDRHLGALGRVILGDMEDLAARGGVSFAQERLRLEVGKS